MRLDRLLLAGIVFVVMFCKSDSKAGTEKLEQVDHLVPMRSHLERGVKDYYENLLSPLSPTAETGVVGLKVVILGSAPEDSAVALLSRHSDDKFFVTVRSYVKEGQKAGLLEKSSTVTTNQIEISKKMAHMLYDVFRSELANTRYSLTKAPDKVAIHQMSMYFSCSVKYNPSMSGVLPSRSRSEAIKTFSSLGYAMYEMALPGIDQDKSKASVESMINEWMKLRKGKYGEFWGRSYWYEKRTYRYLPGRGVITEELYESLQKDNGGTREK